jgi:hypothetical protein
VPLDAISQYNALELLTRNGFALLAFTNKLECSQTKHIQGKHIPKVLNLSQARAPPLFIAPKPNRAVGAKDHFSTRSPDSNVQAPDIGGGAQWSNCNSYFKLAVGTLALDIGGRCTALGVAVPRWHPKRVFASLWKNMAVPGIIQSGDHGSAPSAQNQKPPLYSCRTFH